LSRASGRCPHQTRLWGWGHPLCLGQSEVKTSLEELLMVRLCVPSQHFSSLTITMRCTSGRAGGPWRTRSLAPPASAGPRTGRVPWRRSYSTAEVRAGQTAGGTRDSTRGQDPSFPPCMPTLVV
jgi:hypothetical protein